jgi:hypothetical protein
MPMTARQIIKNTPRSRRDAAISAKIKELKKGTRPNGSVIYKAKIQTTRTPAGERKPPPPMYTYVTTAEFNPKGQCIVSCSCEDFWACWEVALAKRGAARIEYSNGKPANIRNPTGVLGCCKHCYALLTKLIDKNKI